MSYRISMTVKIKKRIERTKKSEEKISKDLVYKEQFALTPSLGLSNYASVALWYLSMRCVNLLENESTDGAAFTCSGSLFHYSGPAWMKLSAELSTTCFYVYGVFRPCVMLMNLLIRHNCQINRLWQEMVSLAMHIFTQIQFVDINKFQQTKAGEQWISMRIISIFCNYTDCHCLHDFKFFHVRLASRSPQQNSMC